MALPHLKRANGNQDGNTTALTLTDGGAGDDDLIANSEIDDPGDPAVPAAQATPIPTLGQWSLLLLAGLLGLLTVGRPRRLSSSNPQGR